MQKCGIIKTLYKLNSYNNNNYLKISIIYNRINVYENTDNNNNKLMFANVEMT